MKTRSFTVPPGHNFVCAPPDDGGVLIVRPGEHVLIVVAQDWDEAVQAARVERRKQQG